ncbi:Hypothetical protein CAP_1596 [Chondromyces apiculatus DSM 436]|uniref:Uncharacterized protein n=1 Tax=Chondromyces apiculatus DSM 436 TaxID=1192034 RepID=A0A017SSV2_9BACT|nr:Hypothetical protein CAP_1596 [Chondromyces apiculatus DSM 436]
MKVQDRPLELFEVLDLQAIDSHGMYEPFEGLAGSRHIRVAW